LPVLFAAREPALSLIPPTPAASASASAGTQVVLDTSSAAAAEILAAIVGSDGASSGSIASAPGANTVILATPVGVSIQGVPVPGPSAGIATAATTDSNTPVGSPGAADPGEQGPTASPETPQPVVPDGSQPAQDRTQPAPVDVGAENLGPGQASAEPLPGGLQVIVSILGDNPSPGIGARVSRRWAATSDWLDDLVRAEAADAAELGRRLAAGALVAGACMALGNQVYNTRGRRNSEKKPDPTIAS
jgi:hypothetical protein